MRYAEISLLLVPAVLLVGWLCGVRGLSRRGMLAAIVLLAAYGAVLLWLGEGRSFTGRYQPARLHGTKIVPGKSR